MEAANSPAGPPGPAAIVRRWGDLCPLYNVLIVLTLVAALTWGYRSAPPVFPGNWKLLLLLSPVYLGFLLVAANIAYWVGAAVEWCLRRLGLRADGLTGVLFGTTSGVIIFFAARTGRALGDMLATFD